MTWAIFVLLQTTVVGFVGVSCLQEEMMLFTYITQEQYFPLH